MTTTNQGFSFAEIEQIVAYQVANAIETITIYEMTTRVAHDLMNQVERQEDKVVENASNKRKWEGDHGKNSSQQQIKGHKGFRPCNHTETHSGNTKDQSYLLRVWNTRLLQECLPKMEEPEADEQA
ncbi:hypothetical protein Tco_1149220 [Tanacetum coccineum]